MDENGQVSTEAQGQVPLVSLSPTKPPPGFRKFLLPLFVFLVLGAGLYVGLQSVGRSTEQRGRAAGADVKLLFVGPSTAVSGNQIQVPVLVDLSASSYKLSAVDLTISYPGSLLTFQKAEAGNFYLKNKVMPTIDISHPDLDTALTGATSTHVMLARLDSSTANTLKIALGSPCPRLPDIPVLGSCETPSNTTLGTPPSSILLTLFFQVKTVTAAQTATLSFTFPQSIAAGIATDGTAITTSVLSSTLNSKSIALSPLIGPSHTPTATPTRSQRDVSSSTKGSADGNVNSWDTGFIMQTPFPCGVDYDSC